MATSAGKITEQGVARLKERIGAYYRGGQSTRVLGRDLIRMYALDMGERNPLYLDEEYARATRYGCLIAPPTILHHVKGTSGTSVGGLPGVQAFHGGSDWEWFHALRLGDRIGATYRPYDVVEKKSSYAGRMVIVYAELLYRNQLDQVVARTKGWSVRTERQSAAGQGKYATVEKPRYTEEQLGEIWRVANRVEVRGTTPRYWEDVQEGDELPPVVKGPLRLVDIAFSGPGPGETVGAGAYTRGAHWYTLEQFRTHPGYAEEHGATGVPDHPHRGHWEDDMARRLGLPGAYDLGPQRGAWLSQLVTNWMGDDGFLSRLYFELRLFNVEGDTSWVKGKVTTKWVEGQRHLVRVDLSCINQRGEDTAPGYAEVVLPCRNGPSEVPL
ncbi:MAG: MaoC family dehydratase N-terminal domain-containing protein [Chloroflexi bacterium]|nr:MaoC family dehydratase N-terminal domain-containing protein [Chloroflexota bacterium]